MFKPANDIGRPSIYCLMGLVIIVFIGASLMEPSGEVLAFDLNTKDPALHSWLVIAVWLQLYESDINVAKHVDCHCFYCAVIRSLLTLSSTHLQQACQLRGVVTWRFAVNFGQSLSAAEVLVLPE